MVLDLEALMSLWHIYLKMKRRSAELTQCFGHFEAEKIKAEPVINLVDLNKKSASK